MFQTIKMMVGKPFCGPFVLLVSGTLDPAPVDDVALDASFTSYKLNPNISDVTYCYIQHFMNCKEKN